MYRDGIDKRLLNLAQREFPLINEPYAELGSRLGIKEQDVIQRIEQLKENGIIRQISPVLDARRLGYQSTLVAMRVADPLLAKAEGFIAEHPGVSHGYLRNHHFNLWFTLSIPPDVDTEAEVQRLTRPIGAEAVFTLPALKIFKIGAYFDVAEDGQTPAGIMTQPDGALPDRVELSQPDRLAINEIQQDLPLIPAPFRSMAARVDMDEEQFLTQCQSLLQRGIMRRFGVFINHRKAGFRANSMTCWVVPPEKVDATGQELASLPEVSHCYERKTNPLWPYNLFAMIHGNSPEACQNIADDISRRIGLTDCALLYSTKEFKKTRVKYLV